MEKLRKLSLKAALLSLSLRPILKAVLLHNVNRLPSIPVAQAVHMKETYDNLKQLLNAIEYKKYSTSVVI